MKPIRLHDAVLLNMTRDHRFLSAFPFLEEARKNLVTTKRGCGRCARKVRSTSLDVNRLKNQLAALPIAEKARLKQLLGASEVTFKYRQATTGQLIKLTF